MAVENVKTKRLLPIATISVAAQLVLASCVPPVHPCKDKSTCPEPHKGQCTENGDVVVCSCDPGYHDEAGICLEDTECDANTCSGHGDCDDSTGVPKCTSCELGYSGEHCEGCDTANGYHLNAAGTACTNDPCDIDPFPCTEPNKGQCTNNGGTAICSCDPDYKEYDGVCRPLDPCKDYTECEAEHRRCTNEQGTPKCGGCLDGYQEESGNCTVVEDLVITGLSGDGSETAIVDAEGKLSGISNRRDSPRRFQRSWEVTGNHLDEVTRVELRQREGGDRIFTQSDGLKLNDGGTAMKRTLALPQALFAGAFTLVLATANQQAAADVYVLQGEKGDKGDPGLNGETGQKGKSDKINISEEAPGEKCVAGGKKIETGADMNGDGSLGNEEVQNLNYVCNGTGALYRESLVATIDNTDIDLGEQISPLLAEHAEDVYITLKENRIYTWNVPVTIGRGRSLHVVGGGYDNGANNITVVILMNQNRRARWADTEYKLVHRVKVSANATFVLLGVNVRETSNDPLPTSPGGEAALFEIMGHTEGATIEVSQSRIITTENLVNIFGYSYGRVKFGWLFVDRGEGCTKTIELVTTNAGWDFRGNGALVSISHYGLGQQSGEGTVTRGNSDRISWLSGT